MDATSRENAALVRRFLTDVVVVGDTDAVEALLTGDTRDHDLVFGAGRRRDPVTVLGWRMLAPTGRPFEIVCVWFRRIGDGRIAEIWSLPDGLGRLRQLDAIPDLSTDRSPTDPSAPSDPTDATEHQP